MKSPLTIPLAIVAAGVLIALSVYVTLRKNAPAAATTGNPALVRPIATDDHIFGNPAASVFIVEYADYDCEYCKGFNEILHQVVANEGAGRVALVFRQFPLTELHQNALTHAEAAECVAKIAGNDAFWKFGDSLFADQPVDPSRYGEFAHDAGVQDAASFASCYATASTTVGARIDADRQNALDVGAQGTPYSVIVSSGQTPLVVDGAASYDAVKQLVDQMLLKTN